MDPVKLSQHPRWQTRTSVHVRLPRDMADKVRKYAIEDRRNVQNEVATMIEWYIRWRESRE